MLGDSGLRCSAKKFSDARRHLETLRDTCRCSETFGNDQGCMETLRDARIGEAWLRFLAKMLGSYASLRCQTKMLREEILRVISVK